MADITNIRNALASQITAHTGLRAFAQARDQASPPCAIVIPGSPVIRYGDTMDGAATINLSVVILMTDGAPAEKTQRELDGYLGIGTGETTSIAAAIMTDTSLGHTVHYCEPVSVTNYQRISWAGIVYFGARLNVQAGAI